MKTKSESKNISHSHPNFLTLINNYVIHPLNEGFFGFGIFLSILAGFKLLSYVFGAMSSFVIDERDIILSSIGFICLFLLDILKHFNQEK